VVEEWTAESQKETTGNFVSLLPSAIPIARADFEVPARSTENTRNSAWGVEGGEIGDWLRLTLLQDEVKDANVVEPLTVAEDLISSLVVVPIRDDVEVPLMLEDDNEIGTVISLATTGAVTDI